MHPKPENRRTNLGVLTLLAAIMLFGAIAAIANALSGNPVRYGVGLGIMATAGLALATMSILVIKKSAKMVP